VGEETVTLQKMHPRTNPTETSESPSVKTIPQIDEALRDFVLQDTANLRREAENAARRRLPREPESATHVVADVNSLVQRVAGVSLDHLDDVIVDLRNLRDFLHCEGERIQREISDFLHLNQAAMGSTKIIADNIAHWKEKSDSTVHPLETRHTETELANVSATESQS
jgi:hypothetical protein